MGAEQSSPGGSAQAAAAQGRPAARPAAPPTSRAPGGPPILIKDEESPQSAATAPKPPGGAGRGDSQHRDEEEKARDPPAVQPSAPAAIQPAQSPQPVTAPASSAPAQPSTPAAAVAAVGAKPFAPAASASPAPSPVPAASASPPPTARAGLPVPASKAAVAGTSSPTASPSPLASKASRDVELQPVRSSLSSAASQPQQQPTQPRAASSSAAVALASQPAVQRKPAVAEEAKANGAAAQPSNAPPRIVAASPSSPAVVAAQSQPHRPVVPAAASAVVSAARPAPASVLVPVIGTAHPLAADEKKEEKKEERQEQQAAASEAKAEDRHGGDESKVDGKQDDGKQDDDAAARTEHPEVKAPDAERRRQQAGGGFVSALLRVFLCGCGSAAEEQQRACDPPVPPPVVAPVPATVPSPPVSSSAELKQEERPPVIPAASTSSVAVPVPAPAVRPRVVSPPVAQPVLILSPPSKPAEEKAAEPPTAATSSIAPPLPVDGSEQAQQLMHPVYSHLPLLNLPASALSQYPPHRPPVPDPGELRTFAAMRSLPLPKRLLTPCLLTALSDAFLPSSSPQQSLHRMLDFSYQQYLDILRACRDTKQAFWDSSFAPSPDSLFAQYEPRFSPVSHSHLYSEPATVSYTEEGTRWCRATEMQKPDLSFLFSRWVLMHDSIRASDLQQGGLGTCYFVAALSSLVDRQPEFVRSLFLTREVSAEGVYQLRLCRNGVWTVVTIDDSLPCLSSSNTFRFTRAVDNQLWPALLEKAYAKLYSSYKALDSGEPHEVLSDLTGCPAFKVSLHPQYERAISSGAASSAPLQFVDREAEMDVLWLQLLEWRSRGHLFCANCSHSHRRQSSAGADGQYAAGDTDDVWRQRYAQVGLVTQHAYSLLDAQLTDDGVRLVKLRNPWSRFVWKGRWSRGPVQTAEAKAKEEAEAARQQERARQERLEQQQKRQAEQATRAQQLRAQQQQAKPKSWMDRMKDAVNAAVASTPQPAQRSAASSSASTSSSSASSAPPPPRPREDRGLFWMQWEDFVLFFSSLYVCEFCDPRQQWQETRIADAFAQRDPASIPAPLPSSAAQAVAASRSTSSPYYSTPALASPSSASSPPSTLTSQYMFELLVSAPTVVFCTVSQPDKRGEPPSVTPQPVYQPIGLHLLQSVNATSQLSASTFSFVAQHWQLLAYRRPQADRQVTAEVLLPSLTSRYLLLPEAFLYGVAALPYTLTVQADRPFYCRRIPLLPACLSFARLLSPPSGNIRSSLLSHSPCRVQEMLPGAFFITYLLPHGAVYLAQNQRDDGYLHMTLDVSKSSRVLSSRAGGVVYDVVAPRTEQVLLVVGGIRRSAETEKEGDVVTFYTCQYRREAALTQFATRIAHHPAIAAGDFHQPRPIVTERRL